MMATGWREAESGGGDWNPTERAVPSSPAPGKPRNPLHRCTRSYQASSSEVLFFYFCFFFTTPFVSLHLQGVILVENQPLVVNGTEVLRLFCDVTPGRSTAVGMASLRQRFTAVLLWLIDLTALPGP